MTDHAIKMDMFLLKASPVCKKDQVQKQAAGFSSSGWVRSLTVHQGALLPALSADWEPPQELFPSSGLKIQVIVTGDRIPGLTAFPYVLIIFR